MMRYTVVAAFALFIISVVIFAYYIMYINNYNILGGNINLDIIMLSLVVISAILAIITYILGRSAGNQAVSQHYMA